MPRRSKYGNKKITIDGITFDSQKEGKRYRDLKLLERAGLIANLELQPRYDITIDGTYVAHYKADFRYTDLEKQKRVVEDVKGVRTPEYRLKKKLVEALYRGTIIEEI